MAQGYKDRMDESKGMKRSMRENVDVMGHASKVYSVDSFAAQREDMGRVQNIPMQNRGNPPQAWDYQY